MNISTTLTPDEEVKSSSKPKLDVQENHYFPTQIFTYQLDAEAAHAVNSQLLAAITEERTRDEQGIQRSNFRALGEYRRR